MVADLVELNNLAKYCHQRSGVPKDAVSSAKKVWAHSPVKVRAWREIRITTVEVASLKMDIVR